MCLKLYLRHSGPFDCHLCSSSRISHKAFSGTHTGLVVLFLHLHPAISLHNYPVKKPVSSFRLSPLLGLLNARITCLLYHPDKHWMLCNQITVSVPLQGQWLAYLLGNDELSNYPPLVRNMLLAGSLVNSLQPNRWLSAPECQKAVGTLCLYPWPRAAGNEHLGRKTILEQGNQFA